MADEPDNPSAFPTGDHTNGGHDGMTLRDYFAGQALAGILTNENIPWSSDHAEIEAGRVADACFELANAMLSHRKGEG